MQSPGSRPVSRGPDLASPAAAQITSRRRAGRHLREVPRLDPPRQWLGARHSKMFSRPRRRRCSRRFQDELLSSVERHSRPTRRPLLRPRSVSDGEGGGPSRGAARWQPSCAALHLTRLPDGRLVVASGWTSRKSEWFHNLDIVNPDDAALNQFRSGTGRATDATSPVPRRGSIRRLSYDAHGRISVPVASVVMVPARLTSHATNPLCRRLCHRHRDTHALVSGTLDDGVRAVSFARDITVPGFAAGDDYYDHFTPILSTHNHRGRIRIGRMAGTRGLERRDRSSGRAGASSRQCDMHDLPSRSA
jgi:hypothetical protein